MDSLKRIPLKQLRLSPIGYFVPEVAPVAAAAPPPLNPPPRPPQSANEYLAETMPSHAATPATRPGDRLRVEALKLAAARIAVEHGLVFADGQAEWPSGQSYIPALTTAIGDDDTFLVAVQIRVSRAELEAAMDEAADQLEEDDEANDRVAAADDQVLEEEVGGGG